MRRAHCLRVCEPLVRRREEKICSENSTSQSRRDWLKLRATPRFFFSFFFNFFDLAVNFFFKTCCLKGNFDTEKVNANALARLKEASCMDGMSCFVVYLKYDY
jgi:hypothetical protein